MDMSARGYSKLGVVVWGALDEADPTSGIRSSRHKLSTVVGDGQGVAMVGYFRVKQTQRFQIK
jgi:hypothetical protein